MIKKLRKGLNILKENIPHFENLKLITNQCESNEILIILKIVTDVKENDERIGLTLEEINLLLRPIEKRLYDLGLKFYHSEFENDEDNYYFYLYMDLN